MEPACCAICCPAQSPAGQAINPQSRAAQGKGTPQHHSIKAAGTQVELPSPSAWLSPWLMGAVTALCQGLW